MKLGSDDDLPSLPEIRCNVREFTMIRSGDSTDQSCSDDEAFHAIGHNQFNFHLGYLVFCRTFPSKA